MEQNLVYGIDVGSNSVGWAVCEQKDGEIIEIKAVGSRIFNKAVNDKEPTPKNVQRRDARLARRVVQRKARRRRKMLNYLISLNLLPESLKSDPKPEVFFNGVGDSYELRTKALDEKLSRHELGRILLHLAARRGFLSTKKQIAGDLIDDPDTIEYLNLIDKSDSKEKPDTNDKKAKDETKFKSQIAGLRKNIEQKGLRTLGEYLHLLGKGKVKRNRAREGEVLRTDRQMYKEELQKIWEQQEYFSDLPENFYTEICKIIFYQRPIKLKANSVGKCSLEKNKNRASMARLEVQEFRYLQQINNLKYSEPNAKLIAPSYEQRKELIKLARNNAKITKTQLKKKLKISGKSEINLEGQDLKGNTTAVKIHAVLQQKWDSLTDAEQYQLVEDLLTIRKKSVLKQRLLRHWKFSLEEHVIKLCLLEFEPGHSNHSTKAIKRLLPYLREGKIYSDARVEAGYGYDAKEIVAQPLLPPPAVTGNPIVNKGLHELRRVINALIKEYGKPSTIRIEMARDLEMQTKRYKEQDKIRKANRKANKKLNEEASEAYKAFTQKNPTLGLSEYAKRDDKIKYCLWKEQNCCCAYSGKCISEAQLFSPDNDIEIDHIVPFSRCLNNSYMNKVVCLSGENGYKGNRTPIEAWGGNQEKWGQITQRIRKWKIPRPKAKYFYLTQEDLEDKGFTSTQLNDTRYIAKVALEYMRNLGCEVSTTKGAIVDMLRHQWGLSSLISEENKKERTDHRHHAIDAAVIACTSRRMYQNAVSQLKEQDKKLYISAPFNNLKLRSQLDICLQQTIVSHDPVRKLTGALHEETATNYIQKHGCLVYRKNLDAKFTKEYTKEHIVDKGVKEAVLHHLSEYDYEPKKAFADGEIVYHKDSKTPIKRVRISQSKKITKEKLQQTKLGIKDKQGKIFKWLTYGNIHHAELLKHKISDEYRCEIVTVFAASQRKNQRANIIQQEHGSEWDFLFALYRNDLVSVVEGGRRRYFRVQKMSANKQVSLVDIRDAHQAKKIPKENNILRAAKVLLKDYQLKKHRVNVIGKLIE